MVQPTTPRSLAPRHQGGFTLIEVMVTVVIIGILVGIAVPSYQNSVRKSHRSAVQAEMLDIANRQQQYLMANRTYLDVDASEDFLQLGYSFPEALLERYTCTVTAVATPAPTFTVNCVPEPLQSASGFGTLTLDSTGAKTPADEW